MLTAHAVVFLELLTSASAFASTTRRCHCHGPRVAWYQVCPTHSSHITLPMGIHHLLGATRVRHSAHDTSAHGLLQHTEQTCVHQVGMTQAICKCDMFRNASDIYPGSASSPVTWQVTQQWPTFLANHVPWGARIILVHTHQWVTPQQHGSMPTMVNALQTRAPSWQHAHQSVLPFTSAYAVFELWCVLCLFMCACFVYVFDFAVNVCGF